MCSLFYKNHACNIFISHSWKYDEHYAKVLDWLQNSNINFINYSIPENKAFDKMTKKQLQEQLTEQIRHAAIVIILGGMYVSYSEWIEYEIDEAVRMGKTIIGVKPWGAERVPLKVQYSADVMVSWRQDSLINKIKEIIY